MKPAWRKNSGASFLYRFVLFFAWLILKVFYRQNVYGLEHFYRGGAIIAANHTSFLDPPVLSTCWPEEVHFLARQTLFKGRFGKLISSLNAHPVSGEASDIAVFKTVVTLLNQGKKVILFPEGTRARNDRLGDIKPGIGLLVMRANAAIIPAYIFGTYHVWGRKRRFPKLWGKIACVFGSPILSESFKDLDKKEAQKAIAEQLTSSIIDLRAWYEAGAKGSPP